MAEAETITKEKPEGADAGAELASKLQKSERALAIERAARAESDRRGHASAAEAARLREQVVTTTASSVESTINSLKSDRDRLIAEHEQALADGDFKKSSELQFKMAEIATKLTSAEAYKQNMEAQPKGGTKQPGGDQQFDRESFISKQSPPTAAWLREHPEYFDDPKIQKAVTGAHHLAEAKGLKLDTPEYFEFIEETAGMKEPSGETVERELIRPIERNTVPKAGEQRRPNVSAPPSRDSGMTPPRLKQGDRYIPPGMVEAAHMTDNTPEQYYDEYVDLVKAGKISDHFGIFRR